MDVAVGIGARVAVRVDSGPVQAATKISVITRTNSQHCTVLMLVIMNSHAPSKQGILLQTAETRSRPYKFEFRGGPLWTVLELSLARPGAEAEATSSRWIVTVGPMRALATFALAFSIPLSILARRIRPLTSQLAHAEIGPLISASRAAVRLDLAENRRYICRKRCGEWQPIFIN